MAKSAIGIGWFCRGGGGAANSVSWDEYTGPASNKNVHGKEGQWQLMGARDPLQSLYHWHLCSKYSLSS
jgi:hypothetical protein